MSNSGGTRRSDGAGDSEPREDEPREDEPPAGAVADAEEAASAAGQDGGQDGGKDGVQEDDWEGVSLEELGAAYARVMAEASGEEAADGEAEEEPSEPGTETDASGTAPAAQADDASDHVTPEAIIEAALFVGHPEDRPLKAKQLAAIIRDVSPGEVKQTINALNASYREEGQAIRIIYEEGGYKLTLAPEMEIVRRAFYGKVREARLSHEALEVLSLVAYQPGIAATKIQDQRGKESGSVLNQLVRRRLLEVRRDKPAGGGRAVLTYKPTERFLNLFELSSLDDLPQVDEADVSPPPS
jgi:segregation and condensation protein B